MKLGLGLYGTMLNADNFRFAKQCGATHIVAHIVGNFNKPRQRTTAGGPHGFGLSDPEERIWSAEGMAELAAAVRAEGLTLEAVENFEPAHWHDILLDGPRRQEQIEHVRQIIRNVGAAGIPVFGYNFSIAGVWGRDERPIARGGATSVGYHDPEQPPIPRGMVWNMIYFRNVRGKVPSYDEMFVDDGDVDMAEAMRILKRNGYDGVIIPDHTPAMSCAAPWHAGKAYALGWMRATLALI